MDAYNYKTDMFMASPPKLWRETDPTEIVRIMNDPGVFPAISLPGQDHFEVEKVQSLLDDPRIILLMTEGGGMFFHPDEPGLYEVHTNFLPTRRGRYALEASLAAYRWMFTHTDCWMLQTRVPAFNKPADAFCRLVGASLYFERENVWPTNDGPVNVRFYTLTLMDWAKKAKTELIESGRVFHRRLAMEFERLGVSEPHHPDEECHDAAVGLCAEMIYGGQPEKAVNLYDRWARLAGYGQIALAYKSPLMIDIGKWFIVVRDGDFTLLEKKEA